MKRGEKSILLVAVAFTGLTLLAFGAMQADANGPVENIDTGETFASIQAAIDDSDTLDGHTITVAAGTYNEQITVHKTLWIKGEGQQTTIIDYPSSLSDTQYLILVNAANVKISNFTLLGHYVTGNRAAHVVYSQKSGLIAENNSIYGVIGVFGNLTNAEIKNNSIYNTHKGLYVTGINNLLINGNTFEPAPGVSSHTSNCGAIYMDHVTGGTISGNTMKDYCASTSSSITSGRGIEGSDNTDVTIVGNTIENNRDGITMWIVTHVDISQNDIVESDRFGINIKGQNISILMNTIVNSGDSGINVAEYVIATENVFVNYNNIYDNGNFGVVINYDGSNVNNILVHATCNWWGDITGPTHATNLDGTGDNVSDNVDFVTWLNGPYPSGLCIGNQPSPSEPSEQVPTVTQLGLLGLIGFLSIVGVVTLRKKHT